MVPHATRTRTGCLPRPKPDPPALILRHPGRAGKRTGHQAASSPSNRPRPDPTSNLSPGLGNNPSGDSSLEWLRDKLLACRTRNGPPQPRTSRMAPQTSKPRQRPGHLRRDYSRILHPNSTPTSFRTRAPSRIRPCHRLAGRPLRTPARIRVSSHTRGRSRIRASSHIRVRMHHQSRTVIRSSANAWSSEASWLACLFS